MFMLGIRWSGLRVNRFRLPGFADELVEREALQGLQPSDEVLGGDELAAVLADAVAGHGGGDFPGFGRSPFQGSSHQPNSQETTDHIDQDFSDTVVSRARHDPAFRLEEAVSKRSVASRYTARKEKVGCDPFSG
jgi:hypothetical protein